MLSAVVMVLAQIIDPSYQLFIGTASVCHTERKKAKREGSKASVNTLLAAISFTDCE